MNSSDITVTNYRLKEALRKANEESMNVSSEQLQENTRDKILVRKAKILKYYFDNTVLVRTSDNKELRCTVLSQYSDSNSLVECKPLGQEKEDYILPFESLSCLVLSYNDDNYLLSYLNNNKVDSSMNGELLLKMGDNKISLTDERLNIVSDNFFINGLPFSEPQLDNYDEELLSKQDSLVAGENITITDDNVISATGELTGSYEDLEDLPSLNGTEFIGDMSSSDLGLASSNHNHNYNTLENLPTLITQSDVNNTVSNHNDSNSAHSSLFNNKADSSTLSTHMNDTSSSISHITSSERTTWNAKQNALSAGANINIDTETNEISATGTISQDYSIATNKPTINGVELSGNKTSSDLGLTTWTNVSSQLGALDPSTLTHYLYVNDSIRIANYIYIGHHNSQTAGTDYERGKSVIPSSYRPLTVVGGQSNLNHGTVTVTSATSTYAGTVWYTANRTETESFYVYVNMYWRY